MAKILYGFSPIGLGHATRSLEIAGELRSAGLEVKVFSGGKAAAFARDQGWKVEDLVIDPVPHVSNGVMDRVVVWYLRSWLALRRTKPRTLKLVESFSPDLIVGDEEFSGITLAKERKIKCAFIADELELGFARTWLARKVESRVARWYDNLQRDVDLLIVPEEGHDHGNTRYVGPVVRAPTEGRDAVLRRYGVPTGSKVVLVSLSGSGIGGYLVEKVMEAMRSPELSSCSLMITGNRSKKITGQGIYDLGVVPENQNLVAAADLVVSTAGKSTIDEAAAAGTPMVAIPIKNHAEQERNAKALGYSYEDFNKLRALIGKKIGTREAPRVFRGAEKASQAILSML